VTAKSITVTGRDSLTIAMTDGGGAAIRIRPID
jgi:hypothetical protein